MRKIICLSDLHVGSRVALAPPKYKTKSGHIISFSPFQQYLYKCWLEFLEFADPQPEDILLMCGDFPDGRNFKENGRQLTTPELEEQLDMTWVLLGPYHICNTKIGVSGSGYHKGKEVDLDRIIIERLGGEWFGVIGFVEVEPTGKTMVFRHGSGCPEFRARKMEKESNQFDMALGREKYNHKIDLIVRAHEHDFRHLAMPHRDIVVLPGWKGLFPYKGAEGTGSFLGDFGGVVINVYKDKPTEVKKKIFKYKPLYDKRKKV